MKNIHLHKYFQFFIILLFSGIGFSLYGQKPEPASLDYPNVQKDIKTLQSTIKAYENGNWDQLRANLDENAMIYNLGSFDSLTVDQTIEYWTKGRESAIPMIAEDGIWLGVSVSEGPRKGNWILHWGNNTLKYPDGQTISFPYHLATLMKDDKIYRIYFYYDNGRIIRSLGYSIDPPVKEEDNDGFEEIEGYREND